MMDFSRFKIDINSFLNKLYDALNFTGPKENPLALQHQSEGDILIKNLALIFRNCVITSM